MYVNSEGSGRICDDKYHNLMNWLNLSSDARRVLNNAIVPETD